MVERIKIMQAITHCKRCGYFRSLVDGLCDNCTIKVYGNLRPWLEPGYKPYESKGKESMKKDGVELPEEERTLILYSNKTPQLQSFLYDMDLLPEQLKRHSFNWQRMLMIIKLWKNKIAQGKE